MGLYKSNVRKGGKSLKLKKVVPPLSLQQDKKVSGILRRIFFAIFTIVFAVLFFQVVFGNMHFSYQPVGVLLWAFAWCAIFVGLYFVTTRFASFFVKHEKICLIVFFILLFATQIFFYNKLAAYPTMDFERVFTGAVNFSVNGFIEEPYLDYFYKYPNNMPLTIVLQFFFRMANRLGFTNFYLVGAIVNSVFIALAYIFVYLCCLKLFNVQKGFFALFLLYLCIPLQALISIFYTDTMTIFFAPFALYMYLRMREAKTWKGILLAAGILAIVMAFGTTIKYSVVITLVAIFVDLLLRLDFKRLLTSAGLFLIAFILCGAAFNSFMYTNFLDKATAQDAKTPFTAWVMMGLKGDGAHNPDDNYLIWNWPTKEQKQKQAVEELENRLSAFTPVTFVEFMNQKAIRSWGSGNMDITRTVADSPMQQNFWVECVSPGGKYNVAFDTLLQGYHVALFGIIILGAALAFWEKDYTAFVPYLSIFGLFLFLLVWESGQRYLVNYYAMCIIAAVFGAIKTAQVVRSSFEKSVTSKANSAASEEKA